MKDILTYDELRTLLLDAGVIEEKDLELADERSTDTLHRCSR